MPRVDIAVPSAWTFATDIPVRITDINYGRHVGNDALVGLLHEARMQWVVSLGYPSELLAEPIGLIMADLAVRFKAESVYGDVLRIQLAPANWSRVGFEVVYLVTRPSDGAEVARACTGMVFFDYQARKIAATPPSFRDRAAGG